MAEKTTPYTNAVNLNGSSPPMMMRVTAPSNLPSGYTFDARVGDSNDLMSVTVPEGGVQGGDVFLVPRPEGDSTKLLNAPTGRWKDGLCDCCANGPFHSSLCCAIFCCQIAMGQVMQRMRLTWLGVAGDAESTRNTFNIVATIVISYFIFNSALDLYIQTFYINNDAQDLSLAIYYMHKFGLLFFGFWCIFALCRTTRSVRETYSIPGTDCEDCLHSTCCSCCTVARIARHTGEFETYPPSCFSKTGLGAHAPMAV